MRRRRFISLLGASLAASPWAPSAIRAQGPGPIRRIGVLIGLSASDPAGQAEMVAFREGLAALGWIEGRNLKIEYRWPGFETDRMRAAARELAELKPEVIVTRTTPGTLAVRSEITRTPIVFVVVAEPIESGLVQSMSRPGGNVTGFTNFESGVSGKVAGAAQDGRAASLARRADLQSENCAVRAGLHARRRERRAGAGTWSSSRRRSRARTTSRPRSGNWGRDRAAVSSR